MSAVIETHALTRRYGASTVLDALDLSIPSGCVYGLLGPNGAGKTTTLDLLMNLLRPTSGEARLLGIPSHRLDPKALTRIGYVSCEQKLPRRRTVDDVCHYLAPLYPTWDKGLATTLCTRLDLPRDQHLSRLSRGQRMKAALVFAIAFRPEVLILDEPFNGLDVVARDELLEGLLDPTQQEGWAILVSSHDLQGLEPLIDRFGILHRGRLALDATVDDLRRSFRQVEVVFEHEAQCPEPLPLSWRAWQGSGRRARFVETDFTSEDAIRRQVPEATHVECSEIPLRDLFLALCRNPSAGA